MAAKKILITGASGFVAPFLAAKLSYEGHEVFTTSRSSAHLPCDLRDANALARLLKKVKPDTIVHLAGASQTGENPQAVKSYIENNVIATANLCEIYSRLRGQKTLLIASTGMVYGSSQGRKTFSESSPAKPATPYGASKLAAEQIARVYDSKDLRVYVARPFNHIGPHQKEHFVCAAFAERIKKAANGSTIQVGGIHAWRDFTDVRDIVSAYSLIIKKEPQQRLFVLGSGRMTRIGSVLKMLIKISGKKIRYKVEDKLSTSRSIAKLGSNPKMAHRVLGWRPRITLEQSLKDLYWS